MVAFMRFPFYQYQFCKVTSKYLLVSERLRCQISTPKRKGESSLMRMVEEGGSRFLMTSVEVEMEERLRVLSIMLANPTMMVMMMPRDIIPPVNVLYYKSAL